MLQFIAMGASALQAFGERQAAYDQADALRVKGRSQLYEGELDKAMRDIEADQTLEQSQREADNIRRQGILMRSAATVAQSGSGVMIGEGSAQAAIDQIETLASADALAALYSGANKSASIRASGRFAQKAGQNQYHAAMKGASSTESAGDMKMITGLAKTFFTESSANKKG